jgi:hypothetical protein
VTASLSAFEAMLRFGRYACIDGSGVPRMPGLAVARSKEQEFAIDRPRSSSDVVARKSVTDEGTVPDVVVVSQSNKRRR